MSILKIGVLSETLVQQHYLKHIVEDSGYIFSYSMLIGELVERSGDVDEASHEVDAWVVVVDLERLDEQSQDLGFQEWLHSLDKPIIFGEGGSHNATEADFSSWTRQLKAKLLRLDGQIQLDNQEKIKASHVWVLAASTGGPEAVKRFLDAMEKGLDIGFIYVQHIDQTQHNVLSDTVARDSGYRSFVASHGDVVCSDSVIVIPADETVELQNNGSIVLHEGRQWRGIYKPSIDQVISNVASVYGSCSGVIFFTGMGDDGSMGCRLMSLHGGQVWAQAISSCVAPSMPQEAINTGYVSKIDTPESLAVHLKLLLKQSGDKK